MDESEEFSFNFFQKLVDFCEIWIFSDSLERE